MCKSHNLFEHYINYVPVTYFSIFCCNSGHRAAKKSSFRSIWASLLPHIVRTKPMSDLCWLCQNNNEAVIHSANLREDEKTKRLQNQLDHLHLVKQERAAYQDTVQETKTAVQTLSKRQLCQSMPNSQDMKIHYSFDFAQQVHFPSNPLQPGPIYFLTPRKCGIFGVCCEAVPQQVNYLIDEGMCTSKGSNAVISYIHNFFENYGFGEKDVDLHCDNCSGQNKNKLLLWYLCWRTLCGPHTSVKLHFLVVGHTKFAPDWCFGLFKQQFRRTEVSCLDDIAKAVCASTQVGVNVPQLVGDERGQVFVNSYDWQSFLDPYFKPLKGIKTYRHFRFDIVISSTIPPAKAYINQ